MGYRDIENREDIDKIIINTLSKFYQTHVEIRRNYTKKSFILNPRLNAAVFSKASTKVLNAIRLGHFVRKNKFANFIMQIYITFAFSKHGLFGCKYLYINELPKCPEKIYIMPGNMKLKIMDYESMVINNIIKDRYEESAFFKEVSIRTNPVWDFILPIKQNNDYSYQEELLYGCTLDRIQKSDFVGINDTIENIILQMQSKNRRVTNAGTYSKMLINNIREGCLKLVDGESYKSSIIKFIDVIALLIKNTEIEIAFSHGDLQNGNIFVSLNNKVYILDWDTYGERSIGYDLLTFYYEFRYRNNYFLKLKSFIMDKTWETRFNKFYHLKLNKKQVLAIYILEDIIWIINENLQTAEKRISSSLIQYADMSLQKYILKIIGYDV
jgi:hypothetical protein